MRKPTNKELDRWFEENRELPEIDDYFRVKGISWDLLDYQIKLNAYSIIEDINFLEVKLPRNLRPPYGAHHSLYWALDKKFKNTDQWNETKANMLEIAKKERGMYQMEVDACEL